MALQLDHVVHVVTDLPEAMAELAALGLPVVPGGEHPGWGTKNALCYFDLTYIELIAVRDEAEARTSDFGGRILNFLYAGRTKAGDGPGTVALRTSSIADDADRLRRHGLSLSGPNPGFRRRPDGSVIAWQLALPPWPWPFLIAWGDLDADRRSDLTARGVIRREFPLRLTQVGWAVAHLDDAAARLGAAYGIAAGPRYEDKALGAVCQCTEAGILLCEPISAGPARARLMDRGEGPFLYDLSGGMPGRLTPALGAWFRMPPT